MEVLSHNITPAELESPPFNFIEWVVGRGPTCIKSPRLKRNVNRGNKEFYLKPLLHRRVKLLCKSPSTSLSLVELAIKMACPKGAYLE